MMFFLMSSGEAQGQFNLFDFLLPFFIVFFIMWLLVIRPQRKEQRARDLMLSNLKKGDMVVTNGGIIGKITKIKDDRIELKVDESHDTKINFLRSAIISVVSKEKDKDEKETEAKEK